MLKMQRDLFFNGDESPEDGTECDAVLSGGWVPMFRSNRLPLLHRQFYTFKQRQQVSSRKP